MHSFAKIFSVLALVSTCTLAHAQQSVTMEEGHLPKEGKRMESRGMEEGLTMKDGKMLSVKDGKMTPMTQEMTMTNGTKVNTDGTVTMADGKTMMLHNGQYMHLDGTLMDRSMMKSKGKNKMKSSM